MSASRRVFVTVLCSTLASLILAAIYSELADLPMPSAAWILTVGLPIVVATPTAIYLVRQGEHVRRLNADLRLAYEELSRIASTDELTGLANRRAFLENAARISRTGGDWLLLADIDRFKSINDRFGHERGDAFLRATAGVLREAAGPADSVGRLGGEEFALLLRGRSREEALRTADTIRRQVAALALPSESGRTVSTTLSIGLTACSAGAGVQDDLKRADEALYRAKRQGRDRVQSSAGEEDKAAHGEPSLSLAS